MSDAWLREATATIDEYFRNEEVNIMRNRLLPALIQDGGRVTYNHSGENMVWPIRYRRNRLQGFGDMDTITFSRENRHKRASLEYRGYSMGEFYSEFEKEKNKGPQALVQAIGNLAEMMADDAEESLATQFYIDGAATGNTKFFHGMESWLGSSGVSSSAPIGTNNSTYAGLSTAVQAYGGSWSGNWPVGTGDPEYDFWTPLVVDVSNGTAAASGGFQNATATWTARCEEALGYGLAYNMKNAGKNNQIDLIVLNMDWYRQFKEKMRAYQQVMVMRNEKDSALVRLGFKQTINFDGYDVTTEYGMPAETGYGIPLNTLEVRSLKGRLINPEGPIRDVQTPGYRLLLLIMGNIRCKSPRPWVKWKRIT